MITSADLHDAVAAALAGQRLGRPVFVRYLLHGPDAADELLARLAGAVAVVRRWLAQPLDRLLAVGAVESGQVSLTLQFRDGATALVGFVQGRRAGVDLTVLGNRGALYHDFTPFDEATPPAPEPTLLAVIERSLRTGRPEAYAPEGRP